MLFSEHDLAGKLLTTVAVASESEAATWYPRIVGRRLNFVINPDHGTNTISDLLSNEADRFILRTIRSTADLIVTTGQTARTEQLRASKFSPMLILTRQAELNVPATLVRSTKQIFVTNNQTSFGNPNAIAVGELPSNLDAWLEEFLLNYPAALFETGLSMTKRLGGLDEVCLTVTAESNFPVALELAIEFLGKISFEGRLIQALSSNGTWFFRFSFAQERI